MSSRTSSLLRQLILIFLAFSALSVLTAAWLIQGREEIGLVITELRSRTLPRAIEGLTLATQLESMRFEGERALHGDSSTKRNEAHFMVTMLANRPDIQADDTARQLVAELLQIIQESKKQDADSSDLSVRWLLLSQAIEHAASDLATEHIDNSTDVLASIESTLIDQRNGMLIAVALGATFQLFLIGFAYQRLVRPLREMVTQLDRVRQTPQPISIQTDSRTTEVRALQNGIRLLQDLMLRNREVTADLLEREQQLQTEVDRANRATQAKTEFLSNISHEIKTPLAAIGSMQFLLARTELQPPQQRQLDVMRQATRHLQELLGDVLDLSRMEAGMLSLEAEPFAPGDLTHEVQELCAPSALEKNLSLQFHVDPALPARLVGDKLRVRQVLLNFVNNALKFTSEGTVRVEMVSAKVSDRRILVRLSVQDSGIGIPLDVQARLFQKFTQADASVSRQFGGTGLGLAICQNLVSLMGGQVGVHSQPGKGSLFWATVWLTVPDEEPAPIPRQAPSSALKPGVESDHSGASGVLLRPHPRLVHAVEPHKLLPKLAAWAADDRADAATQWLVHAPALKPHMGELASAVERAFNHYDLPQAVQWLARAGWHPTDRSEPSPTPHRPSILLVDDTPANLEAFVGLLGQTALVRVASQADRALAILKRHPDTKLALLDVAMPGVDGLQLLEQIRLSEDATATTVVLITASPTPNLHQRALQGGAVALLDRNRPVNDLLAQLVKWLPQPDRAH